MLSCSRSSWVWALVQNELLSDVAKGRFHALNSDLSSVAVVTLPDADSKGKEGVELLLARGVFEVDVDVFSAAEVLPCLPVPDSLLTIHCRISNRFPRSVSKTLEMRRGSG